MKVIPIALTTCLAAAFPARAVTIIAPADDPLVPAQMYRDEAEIYLLVGRVVGSGLSGAGVLISDRWVLTADAITRAASLNYRPPGDRLEAGCQLTSGKA